MQCHGPSWLFVKHNHKIFVCLFSSDRAKPAGNSNDAGDDSDLEKMKQVSSNINSCPKELNLNECDYMNLSKWYRVGSLQQGDFLNVMLMRNLVPVIGIGD